MMMTMTSGNSMMQTSSVRHSIVLFYCVTIVMFVLVVDQAKGLEYNRHKVKTNSKQNSAGPWTTFHVALGGLVCTAAVVFAVAALYLLRRGSKGQSEASMNAFNPELDQSVRGSIPEPHQNQSASEPIL